MGVKDILVKKNEQWGQFMTARDAKGLAGLYAEDCQVMPPGYQTVMGRTAFQKYVEGFLKAGCTGAKLTSDQHDPEAETSKDGTYFWERGHYVFYKEEKVVMQSGKFLALWRKKTDGDIEVLFDCWNTSGPSDK